MSTVTRALARELIELLRSDRKVRDELRAALDLADNELVTISGAAKVASVSPATVSRWLRAGELAATGSGKRTRIRKSDLVLYLERAGRRRVDAELDPERLAEREDGARR